MKKPQMLLVTVVVGVVAMMVAFAALADGEKGGQQPPDKPEPEAQQQQQNQQQETNKPPEPPKPPQEPTQGQQQQQQAQVLPQWQTGMQWQVQSQTYQMQAMGDPEWLPPVQWQYQVAGQQQVGQVPCHVVNVTQQGQQMPVTRMYVSVRDLNLVQTETQVVVGGQQQTLTQQYSQGQVPDLYQIGPAPTQLPQIQAQLPPPPKPGEKAAPVQKTFKAIVPAGGGITFETEVTQSVQSITPAQFKSLLPPPAAGLRAGPLPEQKLFHVSTEAVGMKTSHVVGSKTPWPLYTETATQKSWLIGFSSQ